MATMRLIFIEEALANIQVRPTLLSALANGKFGYPRASPRLSFANAMEVSNSKQWRLAEIDYSGIFQNTFYFRVCKLGSFYQPFLYH